MLSEKAKRGLLNASPEKRYKSFLNAVADLEEIWILPLAEDSEDSKKRNLYAALWPCKEFVKYYNLESRTPTSMEIHEFIELCNNLDEAVQFLVFPTDTDSYIVTGQQLHKDVVEHLEEIE